MDALEMIGLDTYVNRLVKMLGSLEMKLLNMSFELVTRAVQNSF